MIGVRAASIAFTASTFAGATVFFSAFFSAKNEASPFFCFGLAAFLK